MATYAFETITAEQALNIQAGDRLTFAGGSANRISVAFSPANLPVPGRITVTYGDRTVEFGAELATISQRGYALAEDGSVLRIGGSGPDGMGGWTASDALYGGGGDDYMRGYGGDDLLQGNSGNDTLEGDQGANTLYGGQGHDVIYVASYGETRGGWAHGNQGNDEIVGGDGDDIIYGGQGDDFIGGKDGDDVLRGDRGNDEIITGAGDDFAMGGEGADTITNMDGSDALLGGEGDDMLVAYGFGHSLLDGGAGNDTLVAASNDQLLLYGGEGRDRFEFAAKFGPTEGADHVIADWDVSDTISFAQVSIYTILPRGYSEFVADGYAQAHAIADEHIQHTGAQYAVAQVGDDLIVFADTDGDATNGADIAVLLIGRTLADISLQNFLGDDFYIA